MSTYASTPHLPIDATVYEAGSTTFAEPNDTTLVATRIVEAPRDLVWAAHTSCDLIDKWMLGPEGWTMPVCEIDLRPGGAWRYAWEGPDAPSFEMSGEYREVSAPERLVTTESMDDSPVETLNIMTLTEEEGLTTIRTVVKYPSREVRDEIIATGMMDGWAASYDRLEDLLRSMRA